MSTLTGLDFSEIDSALARESSRNVGDLMRSIARRKLGKDSEATLKLLACVETGRKYSRMRNEWIHACWTKDMTTEEEMLFSADGEFPVPTESVVTQCADDIYALATVLNDARLFGGWLNKALVEVNSRELRRDSSP